MAVTWNSADKSADITLSGSDLVATCTNGTPGQYNVRATIGRTTGKRLVKFTITGQAAARQMHVGLWNTAVNNSTWPGGQPGGLTTGESAGQVWQNGGWLGPVVPFVTGDVVLIAIDMDARKLWIKPGAGNWNADAGADPQAGTGGISYTAITGALFPGLNGSATGDAVTADFAYTNVSLPSFLAWESNGEPTTAGHFHPELKLEAWFAPDKVTNAAGWFDKTLITTSTTPSGSLIKTEASDTVVSASKIAIKAVLTKTEASDTSSSATKVAIVGVASKTEASDTVVSASKIAIAGVLAKTEASDTVAATSKVAIAATLAKTEASDTTTSAAKIAIAAVVSKTEASDTSSSATKLAVAAALAKTEASDTLSAASTIAGTTRRPARHSVWI